MIIGGDCVEKKKKHTGRKILLTFFILLFLVGLGLFLYPYINGALLQGDASDSVQSFIELKEEVHKEIEAAAVKEEKTPEIPYKNLLEASKKYNMDIYADKQSKMRNQSGYYGNSCLNLSEFGLEDGVYGVLHIPSLEVEMPILLGATSENMTLGATHMSDTSLPIGGQNTNCVISGHRGWKGAVFFKHLPKMKPGDKVYITNMWDTLEYEVIDKQAIYNTESPYLYIQEGKDLLTLLTCDYGRDGVKFRRIIICERVPTVE